MNNTTVLPVYSPLSLGFWTRFGVTLRPYLLPVSAAAGLSGLALAAEMPALRVIPAFLAFLLSYGFGQALTDVFQTDTDARSSPYRPLVKGEIGKRAVFGVALSGLLGCGVVLTALNPVNLVLAAGAVLGLLAYSPLKRIFWAGPPCNSFIVALLPAMGILCAGSTLRQALETRALPLAMTASFFSYAVFVLLGYLKDVEADKPTGYDTFPVHFGRRVTVAVSAVCATVAVAASAGVVLGEPGRGWAWASLGDVLWGCGILFFIRAHVLASRCQSDSDAHPAIELSVLGFVALQAGQAWKTQPSLGWLSALLFGLTWWLLERRPCREQV